MHLLVGEENIGAVLVLVNLTELTLLLSGFTKTLDMNR